jgi:N-acetylneuraminic acid mutarotase
MKFLIAIFFFLPTTLLAQNVWTRKADTGGEPRSAGVGFAIGAKGYMGFGNSFLKDFWEYDPARDTWMKKADLPGPGRFCSVAFAIGSKGYIGTGAIQTGLTADFWEYDPATNKWAEKESIPGQARQYSVGFSIGDKGYIGTGTRSVGEYYKDFYEYDPAANKWTKKSDFAGEPRRGSVGFSLNGKGYIGLGYGNGLFRDMWQYDPHTDSWTRKADFPGMLTLSSVCFVMNGKAYVGTGMSGPGSTPVSRELWEYDPSTDTWTKATDYPGAGGCNSIAFAIADTGYVGRDEKVNYHSDLWGWGPKKIQKLVKKDTLIDIPDSTVIAFKEPSVDPINNRPVNIQKTITVDTVALDVFVWDDKKYDKDIISLNFNGEWILRNHLLTKTKRKVSLRLDPKGNNFLVLYAINEGDIPPNTVAISYYDNGKQEMIVLNSDLARCGAVNILYRGK